MTNTAIAMSIRLSCVDEMRALAGDLFRAHYDEITRNKGVCVLDPDWPAYERLEAAGVLLVLGAWDGSTMIGYSVTLVLPHLHYRNTIVAQNDVLFVAPDSRGSRAGLALIKTTERMAKERGAALMLWHAKLHTKLHAVLPRLDYSEHETIFAKEL